MLSTLSQSSTLSAATPAASAVAARSRLHALHVEKSHSFTSCHRSCFLGSL